ncbi:MAG: hypothetical protein ACXVPD_11225, partial [Bacteroidia bacterium]
MIRSFFTGLILLGVNGLFAQVNLFANYPTSLSQGSSAVVDVKIIKGNLSAFAKYQVDVPDGITISEIDSKGGNFTFENKRAKIVWVNMPSEPEFMLKFKIAAGGSAPDQATISQKFSYLDNGAKKEAVIEPLVIEIGGMGSLAGSKKYTQTATPTETIASKFDDPKAAPMKAATSTEPEAATNNTKPKKEPVTETKKTPPPAAQPEPVSTTQPVAEPKKEAKTTAKSETKSVTAPEMAAPAPSADGLIFRIQFAASPTDPGQAKYASLGGGVETVKEDGLY